MDLPRPKLLLSILEEHFLELDILWERREAALYDPELTLNDLAELERRAQRHLEGLLLGQGHALDLARAALQGDERGAATAAGFVMMDLGPAELKAELVQALPTVHPEVAHGIRIALRHRDLGDLKPLLGEQVVVGSPLVCACACDVLSWHNATAVAAVRELLPEKEEETRVLAIESIGRWRLAWSAQDLREQLAIANTSLAHRAALETAAKLAVPELLSVCREAAYREVEPSAAALEFLGTIGNADEISNLRQALASGGPAASALAALGALGRPEVVPLILEALETGLEPHAAAAAFLQITAAVDVQGEPVLSQSALDSDAAAFWDEQVSVDPVLARQWWQRNGENFTSDKRWQSGTPIEGNWFELPALSLATVRNELIRGQVRPTTSDANRSRRVWPRDLDILASCGPLAHGAR